MALSDKDRINFILDEIGLGPQALADTLQIPVHKIKSIKIGKVKISSEIALLIEQKFNFDFKWIMTGQGGPRAGKETSDQCQHPTRSSNITEKQRMELIRGFQDKQRALNINQGLMDLERLDPETFKRVESYIKGTVDTVKEVAERSPHYGLDRRREERRKSDDPGKKPDGIDRRRGVLKTAPARKGIKMMA